MNLKEYMEKLYPEETEKLKEKFPQMYEFASEVEVIEWNKEFEEGDVNPEVFDQLKLLDLLFESGLISENKYQEEYRKITSKPARKIGGVSLIREKKVSFRDRVPDFHVILHELGHVYFKELDITWNSSYAGGEVLVNFVLNEKIDLTEKDIKNFMRIYNLIYLAPEDKIETIEKIIGKSIKENLEEKGFSDIPSRVPALLVMSGTLPSIEFEDEESYNLFFNTFQGKETEKLLNEKKIKIKPKSLKSTLLTFISVYLQDGIIYSDPFLRNYALAFYPHTEKILEEILKIFNPYIKDLKDYEEIENKFEYSSHAALLTVLEINPENIYSDEDLYTAVKKEIVELISTYLPIDSEDLEFGVFGRAVYIKEEAREITKEYLKEKKIELPEKVKKILKENEII